MIDRLLCLELEGMDRNEAMIGYLKRAQELEMFGIDVSLLSATVFFYLFVSVL